MHDFCSYVHSMNCTYAYLINDRKIKFRMLSAQHFINEVPRGVTKSLFCKSQVSLESLH